MNLQLILEIKDVIKEKMEKIKEKQRFFDQQLSNNEELEKKIGTYDRIISNAR